LWNLNDFCETHLIHMKIILFLTRISLNIRGK
jgi:hypothetical protein